MNATGLTVLIEDLRPEDRTVFRATRLTHDARMRVVAEEAVLVAPEGESVERMTTYDYGCHVDEEGDGEAEG